MDRIFVVVMPFCPHCPGRKVGSKECTQCDHFRGGIVQNFVDCERKSAESVPKTTKTVPKTRKRVPKTTKTVPKTRKRVLKTAKTGTETKKRGRPAKKAISKPAKTRKKKNG